MRAIPRRKSQFFTPTRALAGAPALEKVSVGTVGFQFSIVRRSFNEGGSFQLDFLIKARIVPVHVSFSR